MMERTHEYPGGGAVEVTIGGMSKVSTGCTDRLVYLVYSKISGRC
jgi:hypothetical protein